MLFALPGLSIFPRQFLYGTQMASQVGGWREVVGGATLKNLLLLPVKTLVGRIGFDNKFLYGSVVGFAGLPYLYLLGRARRGEKGRWLVLTWLAVPVALAFAFSFFVPVFSYFRLLFILPAVYLLLALGVEQLGGRGKAVILTLILATEISASGIYLLDADFQREDWKDSTAYVAQNSGKDTAVLFENNEVLTGFKYYSEDSSEAFPGFTRIPARSEADLADLNKILEGKSKVFLYEYLIDVTDPQRFLENRLVRMGYSPRSVHNFRGVGFIKEYEY